MRDVRTAAGFTARFGRCAPAPPPAPRAPKAAAPPQPRGSGAPRRRLGRVLLSSSLAGALLVVLAPAVEAAPAAAANPCPRGHVRIVCVNLDNQTLWMQDKNGRRTFGPVPVRSGRKGYPTRTGLKRIYAKKVKDWSNLYNVSMPYAQYFDGGQAFHAYAQPITTPPGSHGCVNMRLADAKRLFSLTQKGDAAYIWGRRR